MKISPMKKFIAILKGKNNNEKIEIVLDTCVLIHYFDGTGEHVTESFLRIRQTSCIQELMQ